MISRVHRCDPCEFEAEVIGKLSEPPRTNCPICDQGTFLARVRKAPPMRMGKVWRNNGFDYREDLSRFPNDPEALVDGPTALEKLKEKRLRQGWTFQPISEARSATPPKTDPNRSFGREAYEAAKAKGFQCEELDQ